MNLQDDSLPSIDGIQFRDPARPILRKRPLHAWKHFRALVRNKEETRHVFEIFQALPAGNFLDRAKRLCASEHGRHLFRTERDLVALLDDHETLRSHGPDSVAVAYVKFMESQNLTAAGLNAEYRGWRGKKGTFNDLLEWVYSRHRETHDLIHVLTGYSRDALGEQCVLAFTYGQDRMPGHLLIAYAGIFEVKRVLPSNAPVFRAVREAHRNGRDCPSIAHMSVRELMARPLAEVRKELGIGEPTQYQRCHERWRELGQDPYAILNPGAPA